jgi:hypothetical protein
VPLRLVVPDLPPRITRVEVRRWLKSPGDAVRFGDEICELEICEYVTSSRDASPGSVTATHVRRYSAVGGRVMVTASDQGRLVEMLARPGDQLEVGGSLARIDPGAAAAGADVDVERDDLTFHAVADVVGGDIHPRRSRKERVVRAYRRIAGNDSRLERYWVSRRTAPVRVAVEHGPAHVRTRRDDSLIVESLADPNPRRGVHLVGACDLPALLDLDASGLPDVEGTLAVVRSSVRISGARSDVLLQTLDDIPDAAIAEISEALEIDPEYFSPRPFVTSFTVPGTDLEPFPTSVTVMSGAADVVRPTYRHKKYGLVVDPGGNWLESATISGPKQRAFRSYLNEHFDRIGKLSVAEHMANYRRLIPALREHTGGDVVVFNVLTVEPGDHTHNYQLRKRPEGARRRQFHIAQAELSAELGYFVVDIDRALKRARIAGQLDFAHFPREQYPSVASEACAALRHVGVL